MDYRGLGRSTYLDCVAAQATTTGSPLGKDFDSSEVPACAQELSATDLATFIAKYTNSANTILYGASYGTLFVERVMHLNPPKVTGYVMDGVATASGASADKFFYMSKRDVDFGIVGDRFLVLCAEDETCSSYFKKPNTLPTTLRGLLSDFDKDPNSTCASMLKDQRKHIPPVAYRMKRCDSNDAEVLGQYIAYYNMHASASSQTAAFDSPLLSSLIYFSEMWERPQPSQAEMDKRFENALISTGAFAGQPEQYCAFSKEKSKACDEFNVGNYPAKPITYKRDQYWNKTATIPRQASVLLLSSKLDAQTLHEYAKALLETLDGDQNEMVTFNTSIHGALMWTPLDSGSTCGAKILASYVNNKGNLKGLDKSCVGEMPAFNLAVPVDYQTIRMMHTMAPSTPVWVTTPSDFDELWDYGSD
ncbi:hypothetical protein PHYSODRAFT_262675 [Phytophthora sojae]|uniref:Peptidase S33 tripeptidyl aminopeptidase-like C-terminal domain-containing protein n=1 Tax=Phytophthora sojae (strain P6497) TaxID=1094619 RepID=G5A9Q8_PHYSP|nr:hypothetical protein PHYSODRAFT_262675 [Phytophthora sojae]EGZ07338.1 hypothetical protein PHYSODRAFT_262675 [Phytophthora sojae]|eukprot:XP_009536904.1 hypothetical protein PHYSODRAFT_262675 [Phytophthora sojae]